MTDEKQSQSRAESHLLRQLAKKLPEEAARALAEAEKSMPVRVRVDDCPDCPPAGFPAGIPVRCETYENWALAIDVPNQCIAEVTSADQVVEIANWAKDAGYKVRALGHSHNWSPLVLPESTPPGDPVILVDTAGLGGKTFHPDPTTPSATFGAGVTVDDATLFLQNQDNGGASAAPGYSFLNMTAPGGLSIGGVLTIGAHGTGVPFSRDGEPVVEPPLNGSLSNLITSFEAVVTLPGTTDYVLHTFSRDEADAAAFLVHMGRAFLTRVTLRVVPNYYLQVVNSYPQVATLFEPPTPAPAAESISSLLDRFGRVEVIWFPFTDEPWVKTWERMDSRIDPQVPGPYNYPFANDISRQESDAIKFFLQVLPGPSITEFFGQTQLFVTQLNAPPSDVLNGTSRDLLLYVLASTLRVTAYGYAVQIRRDQVQETANTFYEKYQQMLTDYAAANKYPINGPVEIRYTTMDFAQDLGVPGAVLPSIAATRSIDPSDPDLDTIFWVDALTLPGTRHAGEFFTELETWMQSIWGIAGNNIMRPEWSKGWAYTPSGDAWSNATIITQDIPGHYNQPAGQDVYFQAQEVLTRYDASNLYTNGFLDQLLPPR